MTASTVPSTNLRRVSDVPAARNRTRNPRGQGDRLREEIVVAAAALLDESGSSEAVTLRAVARQAGISAPSIYRHFPDPQAILLAVAQEAFEQLRRQLAAAYDSELDDPVARLTAVCESYLAFAEEHPSRYRVMFGGVWIADPQRSNSVSEADVAALGIDVLEVFTASLVACIESGASSRTEPQPDVVALWLGLHGLAHQRVSAPHFPWPPDIHQRMIHHLAGLGPVALREDRLAQ